MPVLSGTVSETSKLLQENGIRTLFQAISAQRPSFPPDSLAAIPLSISRCRLGAVLPVQFYGNHGWMNCLVDIVDG